MRRINIAKVEPGEARPAPDGFRSRNRRLGRELGAVATGGTVYDLEPGQAVCPYHYEHGEEEWLLVVSGAPSVRTPEGTERLEPNDVVFFQPGPEGAHQIRNDSDAPARVLMWSNVVYPTSTVYPDSDKIGVWTGDESEDILVPRSARVNYFEGEPNP
jgi:uncharacterized cupin superfamily protein